MTFWWASCSKFFTTPYSKIGKKSTSNYTFYHVLADCGRFLVIYWQHLNNDIYQYHSVKDTGGSKTFRIVEPFSSQAIIFRLKLQRAKLSSCGYVRERTYSLFRYRICKLKLSSMCVCTIIYGPTKSFHLIFLWTRPPTCFPHPLLIWYIISISSFL